MDTLATLMTPHPACCQPTTPLAHVAQLMASSDCGQIPVVDVHARVLGVVTDRDIALRAVAKELDLGSCQARDVMTQPAITLPSTASVGEVQRAMAEHRIRRVPVVNERGELAGMVAQADIALGGSEHATAQVVREISEPRC